MKALQCFATITTSVVLAGCTTIDDVAYQPVCAASPCGDEQLSLAVPAREVQVERHGWKVEQTIARKSLRPVYYHHSWLEYAERSQRLFDPEQNRALLGRLKDFGREGRPVYAVVYVHGWHNSADDGPMATGTNAESFDALMGRFVDQLERRHVLGATGPMPRVVGIYVGWKGESVRSRGLLRVLSIADRAEAADRIGAGPTGTGGLRADLKEIAQALRPAAPGGKMVVIGHSLGGRMLSAAFMNDFIAPGQGDGSRQPLGPGSAIVTVNAAVGADCFERLFAAGAPTRPSIPTWMNVTSKDDVATGSMYSLAHVVGLVPACKHGSRARTPIGHFAPFLTHTLQFSHLKESAKWPSSEEEIKALGVAHKRVAAGTSIRENVFNFGNPEQQQVTLAYPWIDGPYPGRPPAYDLDSVHFYAGVLRPRPLPGFPGHFWNVQTDRNTIDFAENGGTTRARHSGIFSTNLTRMLVDLSYAVP